MASAQAMEEELQQSVMLSTDGDYGTPEPGAGDAPTLTASRAGDAESTLHKMATSEDDEDLSEHDASGEDMDEDIDEDMGSVERYTKRNIHIVVNLRSRGRRVQAEVDAADDDDDDDDVEEDLDMQEDRDRVVDDFGHDSPREDEEGEEGDDDDDGDDEEEEEERAGQDEVEDHDEDHDEDGDEDEEMDNDEEEEEEEGVGAVKIKPGGSDDYAESEVSDLPSVAEDDSDDEPAWQEAEEADQDDDESETGPSGICIFCKQDEENDPSEDFEAFLVCGACGENAHQQCARLAAAMNEKNDAQNWKCPECDNQSGESDLTAVERDDASMDEPIIPKPKVLDEEIQEVAEGQANLDDKETPVPNDMIVAGTDASSSAVDGQRMLRKRKTSSVEADESALPLRRRRRNGSVDAASNVGDDDRRPSAESSKIGAPSRTTRQKTSRPLHVSVERRSRTALILKFHVRPGNLREIIGRKRRIQKRPNATGRTPRTPNATSARRITAAAAEPTDIIPTPFTTDSYSQPFYSFFDKETDDMKGKPYGGILTEAEADTSKTLPQPDDRRRFDQAKQRAEDEWRARILTMQAEAEAPMKKSKKTTDNASHIECIEFGGWEIDTWYAAPYPAEYSRNRVLYICEFCLKYMNSDYVAWRHKLKCGAKHPPGDEIYRHASVSVFEVDGRKNPVYCQNLCLLAKLFLGSKTLYYDVEPFLFYVLCEYDDCGYHFVGYFSKEKRASSQNNVSCILTLPIHQRKGYGNLLIDFSYLLTQVEEKTGSPEKPLSDMGLVSYRNYWRLRLCRYFLEVMGGDKHKTDGLSIRQISDDTGMTPDDVIAALEGLRALARDPQTKMYAFRIDLEYCRQYVAKWEAKGYVKLKPDALAWTPYVMGRSNAVNFELGPPINAMVSREDEEARLDEGPNGMHDLNGVNGINGINGINGLNGHHQHGENEPGVGPSDIDGLNKPPEMMPMLSIEKSAPDDRIESGPQDQVMKDAAGAEEEEQDEEEVSLAVRYRDVPPSRFEVFPPISSGRRGGDRSRQTVSGPPASRIASAARPKPKRAAGSTRRTPASRPRPATTTRKKTGGTGRGPGRWPKGTKKSDYGNAESGPGLPPGWEEKQARFRLASELKEAKAAEQKLANEAPTMDEVRVAVAAVDGIVVGGQPGAGNGTLPKQVLNGSQDHRAAGPGKAVEDGAGGHGEGQPAVAV